MKGKKRRILCVEDDADSCEMMTMLLSLADEPYEVIGVGSADEAKALITAEPFDVFVFDVWMAGTDGLQLCRWVRESGIKTPVLFFSAAGKIKDMERAIDAGADAFLLKPNDLDKLVPTVKQLSERGRRSDIVTAYRPM